MEHKRVIFITATDYKGLNLRSQLVTEITFYDPTYAKCKVFAFKASRSGNRGSSTTRKFSERCLLGGRKRGLTREERSPFKEKYPSTVRNK